MRRLEVRLALPLVGPIVERLLPLTEQLEHEVANPGTRQALYTTVLSDDGAWMLSHIMGSQRGDMAAWRAMFGDEFFREGQIVVTDETAESILRATAALRLMLRDAGLKKVPDPVLEQEGPDLKKLTPVEQECWAAYVFLATLQELLIDHLDPNEREEEGEGDGEGGDAAAEDEERRGGPRS